MVCPWKRNLVEIEILKIGIKKKKPFRFLEHEKARSINCSLSIPTPLDAVLFYRKIIQLACSFARFPHQIYPSN